MSEELWVLHVAHCHDMVIICSKFFLRSNKAQQNYSSDQNFGGDEETYGRTFATLYVPMPFLKGMPVYNKQTPPITQLDMYISAITCNVLSNNYIQMYLEFSEKRVPVCNQPIWRYGIYQHVKLFVLAQHDGFG